MQYESTVSYLSSRYETPRDALNALTSDRISPVDFQEIWDRTKTWEDAAVEIFGQIEIDEEIDQYIRDFEG